MNAAVFRRFASALLSIALGLPVFAESDHEREEWPALRWTVFPLRVTAQRTVPAQPWKKEPPERRTGYAVAISSNRLLTVESLVRDHTLVELGQSESARFVGIRVVRADRERNLALMDVTGTPFEGRLYPLPVADRPALNRSGTLVHIVEGGAFQKGAALLLRGLMEGTDESIPPIPALSFLSELPVNGNGAPVLMEGALAGLVARYETASRLGVLIPGCSLRRFAEEAHSDTYRGAALAGFSWAPLPDPALRAFLRVPATVTEGVLILKTRAGSGAAALLQPNDVLIEWDGHPIDHQGYYRDDWLGALPFPALIAFSSPGQAIPIVWIRNGEHHQGTLSLSATADLPSRVPAYDPAPPPWLIEGGLIFRDLSGDYLRAAGANWLMRANARLVRLFLAGRDETAVNGERVPILVSVLPDAINVGYQEISDAIVTHVNGTPVQSLMDIRAVRARDGAIERVRVSHLDVELVLDREALAEANARIAANYRIPVAP